MVTMPDGKYIRCLNCWKLYVSNTNLVDHWNNGLCMHYCTICGQSFHHNIDDLTAHSIREHGVQPITTIVWPKVELVAVPPMKIAPPKAPVVTVSKKVARKNTTVTTAPNAVSQPKIVYPCSLCRKRFNNVASLKMHKVKKHKIRIHKPIAPQAATNTKIIRPKTEPSIPLSYVCPKCDKGFSMQTSLMMHMRYHNRKPVAPAQTVLTKPQQPKLKQWQCKVCAKLFCIESMYKDHLRTHVTKTDTDDSSRSTAPASNTISQPMPSKIVMPLLPKQITVRRSTISAMPSAQRDSASALMPPPPRSATPIPELLVPMKYSEVLKYHSPITSRPKPLASDDASAPRLQVKKLVDLQDPNENRRRNSIDSTVQLYSQQNGSTYIIEHRGRDGDDMNNGYINSVQSQREMSQMPPPQAYPPPHRTYHPNTVHQHQYYDPLPAYTNYTIHMPNTTIPMHEHDHGYYANNFYSNN